ncbi:sialidase family protein [Kribbella sp. NPDC026611]|uniref:sialidase family protein n=1 Tax=Kribbella sp. NPDC026611 TaxID=3154911 RepID=UPI0033DC9D18
MTVQRLRVFVDRYYPRVVERLERLGVPRSAPPLLLLGILAATTSVVLAVVLLVTGGTVPGQSPDVVAPVAAGRDGIGVLHADRAQVQSFSMVSKDRWAAGWSDCMTGPTCRYAAVVDLDGDKAVAPEWPVPYATLQAGHEAIAIAPPREGTLNGDSTMMFRLTYDGPVLTRMRYLLPTSTYSPGEILTDRIVPGRIVIVNPAESSVRMLETRGTRSPVCDSTGRCWLLGGIGRTIMYWSDDRGKSWASTPLDEHNQLGHLTVSPDGRTLITTSVTVGDLGQSVGSMRMSTDRGTHWTTVQGTPPGLNTPPLAFNDGTGLMLGGRPGDNRPRLYRIKAGVATLDPGLPGDLASLSGDASLLYGFEVPKRRTTQVAFSTDQGTTWTHFAPR